MGDYTDSPVQSASSSAIPTASPASSVPTSNPQADPIAPEPNRPDSTILADSPPATPSAQPAPADVSAEASSEVDSQAQPVSTPELQPNQVLEGSASADIIPPADPEPTASPSADLQPVVPESPQLPQSPEVPEAPTPEVSPAQSESQVSLSPTAPEAVKESSIQDTSPPNPPPQVQQDVQVSTPSEPSVPVDQPPKESANIKPEPPEGTQNTIPADSKSPESPKSTSFGDLIANPSDLSEEPAIHIDPIEPPKSQPSEQSISPSLPSDQKDEASDQRRLHANEVRKQKKEDNLAKILEFVQQKGKASNLDIRDFLHVSQSTTTGYLRILVNSGKLKKEGKAKATKYFL